MAWTNHKPGYMDALASATTTAADLPWRGVWVRRVVSSAGALTLRDEAGNVWLAMGSTEREFNPPQFVRGLNVSANSGDVRVYYD